ncbi:hypothetical protein B0H94_107138 [Salsuginibacillus halophilus]|uniref:Transcriptional regulator n=1 Tax=Salsuginibacillus halophilus TaxID=517424 RepID=A0A2P8HFZ8_9BACI|nr:transcription repressor NadR [Salsuginibacillus halophilus]PSL45133.1 hypothetical protein B0H94_107138 [Salsuginibacillus halophilus]
MAEKQFQDKMKGNERRNFILRLLQSSAEAVTGGELADKTNVSRQIIVQDISILKAHNHPIIATSQGYIFMHEEGHSRTERVFACRHESSPDVTEDELALIVEHGGSIVNVVIEHQLYGDLTAALQLHTLQDVQKFISRLKATKAPLLSQLTDGVHLHTVTADSEEQLDEIEQALQAKGFLL